MDQDFYKQIIDAMSDGVYFVNRKRQVMYWNKAAEELSGFTSDEMIGRRCADNTLNHVDEDGKHLCVKGCPLAICMRDGEPREVHVYMHHKTGYRVPVRIRSFPIRDKTTGKITGSVEIFSDDSQHRAMTSEVESLRQEAHTDALTGIGNRRYADLSLERLHEAFRQDHISYGVILVDVDRFKSINDTWGHKVGDRAIQTVAKTLSAALRPHDIACRWGGDEFVVLLPAATPEGIAAVGHRLVHLIRESWIDLGEDVLSFSASVGGAIAERGDSIHSLIERADNQLYLSKHKGRNRFYMDPLVGTSQDQGFRGSCQLRVLIGE